MLGIVRQQQQQVAYCARCHVADPRCTLSATAIVQWCLLLLSSAYWPIVCTHLLHAVCDRHLLLRADYPWIAANRPYMHRVQQHSHKNTPKLQTAVCPTLLTNVKPAERAPVHVPLWKYAYLMLSYHIRWHFNAVLLCIHAAIPVQATLYVNKRSCDVF